MLQLNALLHMWKTLHLYSNKKKVVEGGSNLETLHKKEPEGAEPGLLRGSEITWDQ